MDEFQYQIDLLKALNQKLSSECSMYRMMVNTSSNAFLYYSFEDETCLVLGSWERFFDVKIEEFGDVIKLFPQIREEDVEPLRDAFYLEEKNGLSVR